MSGREQAPRQLGVIRTPFGSPVQVVDMQVFTILALAFLTFVAALLQHD